MERKIFPRDLETILKDSGRDSMPHWVLAIIEFDGRSRRRSVASGG